MQDTLSRQRPPARGTAAVPPSRRRGAAGANGYRRRRRDPMWARLAVVLGALLMMASGGTIVGGKVLIARYTGAVKQQDILGSAADTDSKGRVSISGPINVLLVGLDETPERAKAGDGVRADSIMIAHINAAHDQAFLVSIPRDSYVDIPAYSKSGYRGGSDKINAAFQFGSQNGKGRAGGFELLALTIHQLTGIKFTGGAIVNFAGFQAMVDALDGIDMYIDEQVTSIHYGFDKHGKWALPFYLNDDGTVRGPVPGIKPQVYNVGWQHMVSWEALDYCRQRDLLANGDADYGRQRHQQQFIKAVVKKTLSMGVLTNPGKLDKVILAAGQAFTFGGGGVSLADWIFTLKGVDPNALLMVKTNAGKFNSRTLPNGQSIEVLSDDSVQLLKDIRSDNVGDFIVSHPDWVSRDS